MLVTMRRRHTGQDTDEIYSMFDPKTFFTGNHFSEESDHEALERTIIVKRTDLRFNNQECQVLNFSEITITKQLKKEEEKRKTLEAINT